MTDDAGLTNASTSITSFTSGIISADEEATYNYQKDLVTSLSGVEFIYDCLLRKAKTIANCESRCQSGSDTLENIFNNVVKNLGTNSGECTNTVSHVVSLSLLSNRGHLYSDNLFAYPPDVKLVLIFFYALISNQH